MSVAPESYKPAKMKEFFHALYSPILSESLSDETRIAGSLQIGSRCSDAPALGMSYIGEDWSPLSDLDCWLDLVRKRFTKLPHCCNYTITPRTRCSTKKQYVAGTAALWCDIDGTLCRDWQSSDLAKLIRIGLAPSAVVDSGWGVHLYWFLDSYVPFADYNDSASRVTFCNNMLSWLTEGDFQTSSPEHLLRIPGSVNCKAYPYKHTEIKIPKEYVRYGFEEMYTRLSSYRSKFMEYLESNDAPGSKEHLAALENMKNKDIPALRKTYSGNDKVIEAAPGEILAKLTEAAERCPLLHNAVYNPGRVPYYDWISVGAALAQKFPEDAAYKVFYEISVRGNKSPDPDADIRRHFESLCKDKFNPYGCAKLSSGRSCTLLRENKCGILYNLINRTFADRKTKSTTRHLRANKSA